MTLPRNAPQHAVCARPPKGRLSHAGPLQGATCPAEPAALHTARKACASATVRLAARVCRRTLRRARGSSRQWLGAHGIATQIVGRGGCPSCIRDPTRNFTVNGLDSLVLVLVLFPCVPTPLKGRTGRTAATISQNKTLLDSSHSSSKDGEHRGWWARRQWWLHGLVAAAPRVAVRLNISRSRRGDDGVQAQFWGCPTSCPKASRPSPASGRLGREQGTLELKQTPGKAGSFAARDLARGNAFWTRRRCWNGPCSQARRPAYAGPGEGCHASGLGEEVALCAASREHGRAKTAYGVWISNAVPTDEGSTNSRQHEGGGGHPAAIMRGTRPRLVDSLRLVTA